MNEKERQSGEQDRLGPTTAAEPVLPTVNPATEKPAPPKPSMHPAVYVATWIGMSSSTILFNKYILATAEFHYPIALTAWHMAFATIMTQTMARVSNMLDSRKKVPMTGRVYLRNIVPIGFVFSMSLICGNQAYMYLSVSFIQMLKATMPVVTLLTSWTMGVSPPSLQTLGNVSLIVFGVIIASYGEIQFNIIGFVFQCGGIIFEAIRLVMVERLLSGAEFKMDPLVSLYYYAPVCAVMNSVIALFIEVPQMSVADFERVGYLTLLANAMVAFLLNVSVVFLIGKTSSLVMTLCGVLKDILLVMASMFIFRDPVSALQAFGYSIALCGLVYYKLGAEKLRGYFGDAQRAWADQGVRNPAIRKIAVLVLVVFVVVVLVGGVSSAGVLPPNMDPVAQLGKSMGTTGGVAGVGGAVGGA